MEVTIGVQNVAREVVFESDRERGRGRRGRRARRSRRAPSCTLTDDKGRQLLVPAAVLGYVQIGESDKRGVGFGV